MDTGPVEVCEVCGRDVNESDVVRIEASVGQMMCPSNMVLHRACHEKAATLWSVDDDDPYCTPQIMAELWGTEEPSPGEK